MIKTLSSNAINIYIFPDVNSTTVRAYMEATFMFRLTPLCAKDDDRAPVRRAIWKPTPKIFGVTYIKCSLEHKGPQDGRKTVTPHCKRPSKTTTTSKFTCVLSLRRSIVFCIGTVPNEKISCSSGRSGAVGGMCRMSDAGF